MKILTVVCLSLLLFSCSKSDKEAIKGNWKLDKVYQNNQLLFTSDKKVYEKITDSILDASAQILAQMNQTKAQAKSDMMKNYSEGLKSSFNFTAKTFKTMGPGVPKGDKGIPYSLDEKKKTIEIGDKKDPRRQPVKFSYKIDGDQLTFDIKEQKTKQVFVRK